MAIARQHGLLYLSALLMGFGYGVFQPIIYDKATYTVTDGHKSTLALAIVLSVNYIAITITPFIVDMFRQMFGTTSNHFPFILNFVFTIIFGIVVLVRRNSFAFRMSDEYV